MTVVSDENVLGFQVSVDDAEHVEILKRQQHLCSVEPAKEKETCIESEIIIVNET